MVDTPQAWAARNSARIAVYTLLAIVLVLAFLQVRKWRDDAKTGAERIEQRDETATATTGIAADYVEESTERQRVEVFVTAQNAQLARDLETLRNANPDLDHWLSGPVPDQLQQLARERREARDGLGAAAPGSAGTDQGAPAPGTGPAR